LPDSAFGIKSERVSNCTIDDSLLMGQILPALAEDQSNSENGNPPLGISANTTVRSSTKNALHYCNVH